MQKKSQISVQQQQEGDSAWSCQEGPEQPPANPHLETGKSLCTLDIKKHFPDTRGQELRLAGQTLPHHVELPYFFF